MRLGLACIALLSVGWRCGFDDDLCRPTAIASGEEHTCAVRADGSVWCWGRNDAGQLGIPKSADQLEPVQVMGLPPITAITGHTVIAAGSHHSCAIDTHDDVWCWGFDNDVPSVTGVSGAVQIVAGISHTCARAGGGVTCWGDNGSGQLGNDSSMRSDSARAVTGLMNVTAIAAGGKTSCAIDGDKMLWCWGANDDGQFGNREPPTPTPTRLPILDVTGVAVGANFICAMTENAGVSCFGSDDSRQISAAPSITMPSGVPPVAIAAGEHFACVASSTHALSCWGDNRNFELIADRSNQTVDGTTLGPVASLHTNVAQIAAGGEHLCTLSQTGALLCSGYNGRGQIGDGLRTTHGTPTAVDALTGVRSIAGGDSHTCAVNGDQTVWCWGKNESGQLGNGSMTDSSTPTQVKSITGATQVATGNDHSCALSDGGVTCWGSNDQGQLGDGTVTPHPVAVKVLNGPVT